MTYDPENKALEALETERDNLRVELAAARRVIASGYGTCSSCKWWTREEASRPTPNPTTGDCALFSHPERGPSYPDAPASAWGSGWECDESGFTTNEDFGCVAFVQMGPSVLSLPPLEINAAPSGPSRIVVTEHPFPIVHTNHLPEEDPT